MHKKEIGQYGEEKAVKYLIDNGYSIVARNWRNRYGEIDIICTKKDFLIFIEVKTLPSGDLHVLEHELDVRKQKRIVKTAKCFLSEYRQYICKYIRFDVLVIDMPVFTPVYHIQNAFSECV